MADAPLMIHPQTDVAASDIVSSAWLGVLKRTGKVNARFSCGAASAVATKIALDKYGDSVEIYNTDPGSEHPDNARFMADCERWFGRKIHVLRSDRYRDVDDVIERRHFIVGPFSRIAPNAVHFPFALHSPSGDRRRWQVMSKTQRSATHPALAAWLVATASLANTQFRDAGSERPALRTGDKPHSL